MLWSAFVDASFDRKCTGSLRPLGVSAVLLCRLSTVRCKLAFRFCCRLATLGRHLPVGRAKVPILHALICLCRLKEQAETGRAEHEICRGWQGLTSPMFERSRTPERRHSNSTQTSFWEGGDRLCRWCCSGSKVACVFRTPIANVPQSKRSPHGRCTASQKADAR